MLKVGEKASLCSCCTKGNFREHFADVDNRGMCLYCGYHVRNIVVEEKHIFNHKKLIDYIGQEEFDRRKLEVFIEKLKKERDK